MPIYEFRCTGCERIETVFKRTATSDVAAPACTNPACSKTKPVVRAMSKFARHMTEADQIAEAEAKWGKEVDAAMGPTPDIGKYSRRYEKLAADLPPPEQGVGHP